MPVNIVTMNELVISTFAPSDQHAARALVLAGLEEHWGVLDLSLNPDLNDIAASYAGGVFLVGRLSDEIVATGALMPERVAVDRVVRMSVAKAHRRRGLASAMLNALIGHARQRGCHTVVLETTETWDDAIGFYLRNGFRITHHADGDAHFVMAL